MSKELSLVTLAARRHLSRIGISFFAFFAVTFAAQILLVGLVTALRPAWLDAPIFVWLQSVAVMYGLAFPLYYLVLRPLPTKLSAERRMRPRELCILFFISFAVMYITNLFGVAINSLTDTILGRSSSAGATEIITDSPLYLTVIFAVIIGPIVEEIMFRGILLPRLLPFGEGFAVLTSALLFGLFHGNFSQFFYAFAIGLIFALVTARTGRLRYTVILHVLLNFFGSVPATLLARRTERLDLDTLEGEALLENPAALATLLLSALYSILLLATVALGLFFLSRYARRMRPRPAEYPIPKGEGRYLVLSVGGVLYALTLLFLFVTSYL